MQGKTANRTQTSNSLWVGLVMSVRYDCLRACGSLASRTRRGTAFSKIVLSRVRVMSGSLSAGSACRLQTEAPVLGDGNDSTREVEAGHPGNLVIWWLL